MSRGCFGSAVLYRPSEPTCKTCSDCPQCAQTSRDNLTHLQQRVDVSDVIVARRNALVAIGVIETDRVKPVALVKAEFVRRHEARKEKHTLTETEKATCAALPKNAAKILDALIRHDRVVAMKILPLRGENPFRDGTPRWLEVTFDALIAGGFSKLELKESLMHKLEWVETSAYPHVSKAIAILSAINVIQERAGRFVLIAEASKE